MPSAQELSLLEGSASRSAVHTSVQAEENLEEGAIHTNKVRLSMYMYVYLSSCGTKEFISRVHVAIHITACLLYMCAWVEACAYVCVACVCPLSHLMIAFTTLWHILP